MTRPPPSLLSTAARLYRAAERARRTGRPVRVTLRLAPEAAARLARVVAHEAYKQSLKPAKAR